MVKGTFLAILLASSTCEGGLIREDLAAHAGLSYLATDFTADLLDKKDEELRVLVGGLVLLVGFAHELAGKEFSFEDLGADAVGVTLGVIRF